MKAKTIEELINKYPKIFVNYQGNPGGVNWLGIEKGWVPVIDLLCGSIQNYIDSVVTYVPNPSYDPSDPNSEIRIKKQCPQVVCTTLKEKFGGLRFYYHGGDDEVEGMVKMAEYMCDNTCERCGTTEDIGVTGGWIKVLCRSCAEKESRIWKSYDDV